MFLSFSKVETNFFFEKLINFFFAALNLKEIPYDIKPISLVKSGGEQHSNEFREINPMEQVPALHIDNHTLIESVSLSQFFFLIQVFNFLKTCF